MSLVDDKELLGFLDELDKMEDGDEKFAALFRVAGELHKQAMSGLRNEDFEVDPDGMQHFTEFASFMAKQAKQNDGRIELDLHEPKSGIAGLNAYFRVFWLMRDDLRTFCKLLVWASSWSIDALEDGTVCISVRFVGVYHKKTVTEN